MVHLMVQGLEGQALIPVMGEGSIQMLLAQSGPEENQAKSWMNQPLFHLVDLKAQEGRVHCQGMELASTL